ncbi:MAG: DNA-binding transcriptional regulator [Treponema sp.]|jgi:LacI family transcriptional regulator|nr:DNA-binding transcriptional regulator [Treponema sp.]
MNIGLYLAIDDSYTRGITRGIIKYAKMKKDWNLLGHDWMFDPIAGHGNGGRPTGLDGIISRIESRRDGERLKNLHLPVVDVAGAFPGLGFVEVHNDDYATGRIAGETLQQLGHSSFAWAGAGKVQWSSRRKKGYREFLFRNSGISMCSEFERPLDWWEQLHGNLDPLVAWLHSLENPTAIFTANDTIGLKITRACATGGIAIPENIALLGVDNEDILCELANPSLSSIPVDGEQMGRAAAEQLDLLIKNKQPSVKDIRIAPFPVAERESTRIIFTKDPLVTQALNFIYNRAHTGILVEDILSEVSASRRNLEQHFRTETGRTLHEEIIRAKITYSKRRMRETDSPLDVIARQSGFGSVQRFFEQFKKINGITPSLWRRATKRNF